MKQRKYLLIFLSCIVFLGGTVVILIRPGAIQSTSPDGRLIAHITFPSLLSRLSVKQDQNWSKKMRVRLQVTDTQTGENVEAYEHTLAYLLGDGGEYPQRLVWSSDSRQLTYEFAFEPGQGTCVFHIKLNPLNTHILDKKPPWFWGGSDNS
jgi:hypothetical protein